MITNWLNHRHVKHATELVDSDRLSKTTPKQAIPIAEMIRRSQRGIPIPIQTTSYYDENINPLEKRNSDISDVHELLDQANQTIDVIDKRRKKREEDEAKRKDEEQKKASETNNVDNK